MHTTAPRHLHASACLSWRRTTRTGLPGVSSEMATTEPVYPLAPVITNMVVSLLFLASPQKGAPLEQSTQPVFHVPSLDDPATTNLDH